MRDRTGSFRAEIILLNFNKEKEKKQTRVPQMKEMRSKGI